jgi:predicted NBD/HSP70 family sugar kinase
MVASLVSELEEAGMVLQHAEAPPKERSSALGRPPLHVSLCPTAAYAVGLDFGYGHIRAAVCDLSGGIVAARWSAAEVADQPRDSLDLALELVEAAFSEAGVAHDQVIGVGVGLTAPVRTASGEHVPDMLPKWRDIRIANELERRLAIPVLVENDANAGAMGELLFGAARGHRNVLYVRLSAGVGLGLVVNGQPYRGAGGIAGEIGHVRVVENGLICRCGNLGCLETVASSAAVLDHLARSGRRPAGLEELMKLLDAGDRGARRAVNQAAKAVGSVIASAVNLHNPELVIVGGDLAGAGAVLLEPIRQVVAEAALPAAASDVRVVASELGESSEVLGAAAVQLSRAPALLASRITDSVSVSA